MRKACDSSEVQPTPDPKTTDGTAPSFQLDALGVRGRLVRLGPALDAIIERHGYPLAVARPLAEAMVLCAALATSLKYDGIFTLQITRRRADPPAGHRPHYRRRAARLCPVQFLEARGGAGRRQQRGARRLCAEAVRPRAAQPSPSTRASTPSATRAWCRSRAPTLADCAHTYFRQSEQLPTGIKIAARAHEVDGTPHWRAAALMVQQMPEFDAGRIHVDRRAARGRLAQAR